MLAKRISIAFGLLLIAYSSAALLLHYWFPDKPQVEQFFCRFYLCANEQLVEWAHERLWQGDAESVQWAVAAWEESLRRDPASPIRWCDLGEALVRTGELERARYCFEQGVELGRNSPPILIRAAHFYFGADEEKTGLELMARILKLTREYNQVIFSHHTRMGISVADVLRYGMPEDSEAVRSYFSHLLNLGEPADLAQAWGWMASRSLTDDASMSRYVNFLLGIEQFHKALQTLNDYLGERERDQPSSGNLVFNPGFEYEPLGVMLDWTIRRSRDFETERDSRIARTGSWSLRIRFAGQENVSYRHLAQKVVVKPGLYRFRAYVRTEGITTDQGVGFRIFAADRRSRLNLTTEPLLGTNDWTLVEKTFSVPRETKLLEISAFRSQSRKFDNKITGSVWIDDVSLVRQ